MANTARKEDPTFALRAIDKIRVVYPEAVLSQGEHQGQAWAVIAPPRIVDVCRLLRDEPEFLCDFLRDLCGVDNLNLVPYERRFQVVYQVYSLKYRGLIRLKVELPEENPEVDSVVPVWAAADWQEREAYDMYGIRFRGHPDLRRVLMNEDYRYFPQRKDFPIEGIHDVEGV